MEIKLPNGDILEFPSGSSPMDVAQKLSAGLAKQALVARVDSELWDMNRPLPTKDEPVEIELKKFADEEGKQIFWHSTAHIMAYAVRDIFPDVKVAIGPAIEEGFYYDFDKPKPFTPEDLERIESRMAEIIEAGSEFVRSELSRDEAYRLFAKREESYKLELLDAIPADESVALYTIGEFTDLCRGPHVPDSGRIKYFKLISIAGAYWRGDETRQMLQRIYGVSYPKKSLLDDYIMRREEAEKRDHRKLGKELDLFFMDNEVGPGLVMWTPNGSMIREIVEDFWRTEHRKNGYQLVYSPHVGREELWKRSGHLGFYDENMYPRMELENQGYYMKPMNCPFHIKLYNRKRYSYRELPLRWAELGTVYRYERSGVLHGLLRVRGFTQDDAHIICRPDQVESEILRVLKFSLFMLKSFGFKDFHIYLSTRPTDKFVGEPENWELAQESLRKAIIEEDVPYDIDEGGGAFYGPKIDIKVRDALGREWQLSTIQFDFNLPERFDMTYMSDDGSLQRPYVIHRALLGALERFFATLIEHFAGNFPLWLSPVQVIILPVSEKFNDYGRKITDELFGKGIRAEVDVSDERVSYKIRGAEVRKIPYMAVVGGREEDAQNLSVRRHGEGDIGAMTLDELIERIQREVAEKT